MVRSPIFSGFVILFLLFFASVSLAQEEASPRFSNFMVFGDSQSDGGNFPASLYYANDSSSSSLYQIATNLYVPVTAPMDQQNYVPLYPNVINFPEITERYNQQTPSLTTTAICTGTDSEGANCQTRQSQSVGWVNYFAYNGARDEGYGLFEPVALSSWVAYADNGNSLGEALSINYAWYGALSTKTGCYNGDFVSLPASSCSYDAVYSNQKSTVKSNN